MYINDYLHVFEFFDDSIMKQLYDKFVIKIVGYYLKISGNI